MVPPTFYFAIGARSARSDLEVALSVGQTDFLIPVGATVLVRGNRNLDHARHEMKTIYIKQGTAEYHVYADRE